MPNTALFFSGAHVTYLSGSRAAGLARQPGGPKIEDLSATRIWLDVPLQSGMAPDAKVAMRCYETMSCWVYDVYIYIYYTKIHSQYSPFIINLPFARGPKHLFFLS